MKLKVTKMSLWGNCVPSMVWWWWWMICLVVLCPLDFRCRVLKGVQKVMKTVLQCALLFFSSSKWSWKESIHWMWHMIHRGLERSPKFTVYGWSWKNQFPEGSLPWRFNIVNLKNFSHGEWKHYVSNIGVLKGVNLNSFCAAYKHRVLKWVDLMMIHRGLERSQYEGVLCRIQT